MGFKYTVFKKQLAQSKSEHLNVLIAQYLKAYDDNEHIEQEPFYLEYLAKFPVIDYKIPSKYKDDFDWDLLLRLVVASESSDYRLTYDERCSLPELIISISSGSMSIVRAITKLDYKQIYRMHEIYLEEQMNMQITMLEGDICAQEVQFHRNALIKDYRVVYDNNKIIEQSYKQQIAQSEKIKRLLSSANIPF